MKKIIICIVFTLFACNFACSQGLYTSFRHYDKFDDCISERVIKTLITETDSTIIIETKGEKPVTYYKEYEFINGRKDSVVNITADVYGYERGYICFKDQETVRKKTTDLINVMSTALSDGADVASRKTTEVIKKYEDQSFEIIFRTITTQYSMTYQGKVAWVKYSNGERIIYLDLE